MHTCTFQKEGKVISKQIQKMVGELDKVRRDPDSNAQARAGELAMQIGRKIPKRILRKALLRHPPEIQDLIYPQDQRNSHPVRL